MQGKQTRVVMDSKVNVETMKKLIRLMNTLCYPSLHPNIMAWLHPSSGYILKRDENQIHKQCEMQHMGTHAGSQSVTQDRWHVHLLGCNTNTLQTACLQAGRALPMAVLPPPVHRPQNCKWRKPLFSNMCITEPNVVRLSYTPLCRCKIYPFLNSSL